MLGLSVLNHFHTILVFGFASVSIHPSEAVRPSVTMDGFGVLDVTSGLSNSTYEYKRKNYSNKINMTIKYGYRNCDCLVVISFFFLIRIKNTYISIHW